MKIAIGRLGHIGDIIACEPVSRYLRIKHPEAHLSWVVETPYRELIDTNPHVDATVAVGCTTDWIKLTRHGAYDRIVDLHPNYRGCPHCRVPLVKRHGNPFVSIYEHHDYGTLLESSCVGAGLPKLSAEARLYLRPEHAAAVDALGLPAEYCVIHRESTSVAKDWPVERWRTVVGWIRSELGIPVVEVGATRPAEPSPLADIAIDLVNRTSILATAEVIRRARFFVGVDSAPAHMANAVRTPGIVLLGWLNLFRSYMPFNGLFAADTPEVRLVRNPDGPVREIPVVQVVDAIRQVAGAAAAGRRAAYAGPAPSGPAPTEAQRQRVRASGLFDHAWYLVHHPEAASAEPLNHFLAIGGARGFSPGPDFDTAWYVAQDPEIARSGLNPLVHFLERGRAEGRPSHPPPTKGAQRRDGAVPRLSAFAGDERRPAVAAAAEGMPRIFAFQPAQPGQVADSLGAPEILREQMRAATSLGITGVAFRAGGTGPGGTIEAYLGSDMPTPFVLVWADDDGREHSEGDDQAFVRALVPLFEDERYATVDGKPLLLLDRAARARDSLRRTMSWRDAIRGHGFPDLHLVIADHRAADLLHPRMLGFDAAYEAFDGSAADGDGHARHRFGGPWPEYKWYRSVMPPARTSTDAAADAYRLRLTQALLDTRRRYAPDERLVFLHGWTGLQEETRQAVADARKAAALDDGATLALLRRIEDEKDEEAFRVIQATQRALQAARAQLAAERRALTELQRSTSWRVTAPLRAASGGLRTMLRRVRRR